MSLRGFSLHLYCGLLINCGHVLIFISLSSFVISVEISILNSWLILGHFLFFFLFLSISSKLLSSIFFFSTSFLLVHLWGIIFHAWWYTLVMWFLYLSSYIKNFIFCSIWSNLSICCFSYISFRFRSWGGITYQLQSLIQFYLWFFLYNFFYSHLGIYALIPAWFCYIKLGKITSQSSWPLCLWFLC